MKTNQVFATVFSIVLKVVIIVAAILLIYKGASTAYDYGYRLFTEPAVSQGTGREVTVSVTSGKSAKEVGQLLESKGLIRDAKLFALQERISDYHGKIQPGIYTLSSSMTADEMLAIMTAAAETEESQETEETLPTAPIQETEEESVQETEGEADSAEE